MIWFVEISSWACTIYLDVQWWLQLIVTTEVQGTQSAETVSIHTRLKCQTISFTLPKQ